MLGKVVFTTEIKDNMDKDSARKNEKKLSQNELPN
jgi:hypothetical protein